MLKKMFSYFFKCKNCIYTYFAALAAYFVYMAVDIPKAKTGYLLSVHNIMQNLMITAIAFVLFLFISYEFFSRARRVNFFECARATKGGAVSLALNQFFVLELLSLLFTAVVMVFTLVEYSIQGITDPAFVLFSLRVMLFYFFCTDTIAVLIALLLSFVDNNITAYILLAVAAILFSPFLIAVPEAIWAATESIYLFDITDMFEIFPNDYSIMTYGYIVPLNKHNYALLLFWVSLLIALIAYVMLKNRKKQKRIICVTAAALAVVCLVSFNMPYSEASRNFADPQKGYMANAWYYEFCNPLYEHMQYNEPADFNITSMDIDLKVKNQLKAEVTLKVDNSSLDEYKFTLSHFYKVKSIKNAEGNELDFSREGDYLTVYNSGNNDTLSFTYSGASYVYYSNTQGIYLPAGFAFYPINGFHYVHDMTNQGSIRPHLSKSIPITLSMDYNNEVFSNLSQLGDGEFSGVSDGITIVSGFYKEMEFDGCRVIYRYLANEDTHEEAIQCLKATIANNREKLEGKTIITSTVNGNSADDRVYEASDHIVAFSLFELESINESREEHDNAPKISVMDMYYRMLSFYDEDSELKKCYNSIINNEDAGYDKESTVYLLAEKIAECGDAEVLDYIDHNMLGDWIYPGETAVPPYDENILVRHIGEKTQLELDFEEYEREIGYDAEN